MEQWIKDMWTKNKFFFFILIPILLILKWRNVLINLLLANAKQIDKDAKTKDVGIETQISDIEKQTTILEKDISNNKIDEPKIDENWYKKK